MQTFNKDVQYIKKLVKEENEEEIRRLSKLFIPEYILKVMSELNKWERDYWMRTNG